MNEAALSLKRVSDLFGYQAEAAKSDAEKMALRQRFLTDYGAVFDRIVSRIAREKNGTEVEGTRRWLERPAAGLAAQRYYVNLKIPGRPQAVPTEIQFGGGETFDLPPMGCDLRLMPSVNDVSGIPTEGRNLVIVADVNNVLHFRIFERDGRMGVDTDETKLKNETGQINDLRDQLKRLWPPHELTRNEKIVINSVVALIVAYPCVTAIEALHWPTRSSPTRPRREGGVDRGYSDPSSATRRISTRRARP